MLSIEGDNISAIDVAFHLEELKASIYLQRDEHYLTPTAEIEKNKLIEDYAVDGVEIDETISRFYGNHLKTNLFCL